ncbi:N-acetyl-gamma-glutamyl-phosphate reductase [Croceicoccus naphthovorans]|uniref:N-acetyl-gamma-glutamyl-phosphate reductase n=1 Tax=Croceicoccus naphthovorans TaxID=1348774 RepID=A0A0G3XHU2_9SPHN|nr:N-acetyl-gamma-glutamyl-phosphate reductase [Croceicoccus naphthovorans]AKM10772.1 N-acetyl-gamma-glutamyl-phosphate reductase [Croceicoccus naphthovorans]MBB3988971.1 N-acetyl-gamma-glutamyl-phosphate reductase [Croceicoccus naphthovorans]
MSATVFIDGAAGTTGLEIAERLAERGEFTVVTLPDHARKDDTARAEALNDSDFAILCLPDEAAVAAVGMIRGDTRVIDASTAHRTADGWAYGFPELIGEQTVAEAKMVANPGCYPTGFLALVAPLVRAGLIPADWPYACHAVSGYSGGGKALIERYEAAPAPAFRAYGLHGGHKHLNEMKVHGGLQREPIFSPAVVPAFRGMVVEVALPASAFLGSDADALRDALSAFYEGSPIVTVMPAQPDMAELLLPASMEPWDGIDLHVFGGARGEQARLIAVLDNLGKGASGAALQNLNLMAGLSGETGLRLERPF